MIVRNAVACLAICLGLGVPRAHGQMVSTKSAPDKEGLPSCYNLAFGRWSGGGEHLSYYQPLPSRIALTDKVHSAGQGYRTFEVIRWPADTGAWEATWRPVGQDSVLVNLAKWSSSGVQLTLRRLRTALVGQAAVYTDALPNRNPHASVRAARVACPASLMIGKRGA